MASHALSYGADGGAWLDIAFPDTPHLGCGRCPARAISASNHGQGHADPEGFAGDCRQARHHPAAAGEARSFRMDVALRPPARGRHDRRLCHRRTLAIISHPDAGKTTLTEKLLLNGGAIHLAGEVKARGAARRARSDWMKIEQQRGISVTFGDDLRARFRRAGAYHLQPARHAGPRGLLGRHLSHADRGGFWRSW
jgi:hypothetical protein